MRVSVITVCRNAEKTIERCIKSVIAQRSDAIEYIIVDGGSTDGTLDVIYHYKDVIYKLVSEPDDGIYDAMNKGVKLASGDYIGFLNSDDYYDEGAIHHVLEAAHISNADVVFGDVTFIDQGRYTRNRYKDVNLTRLLYEMPICHQGIFVKRELLEKNIFDTTYMIAADYKTISQLYIDKHSFVYAPYNIAFFSKGGISTDQQVALLKETNEIINHRMGQYASLYRGCCEEIKDRRGLYYYFEHKDEIMCDQEFKRSFIDETINISDVVIFGAGHDGEEVLRICQNMGIGVKCFVDSNRSVQGQFINDICVKEPVEELKKDHIIVIAASRLYFESMIKQASMMMKESSRILSMVKFMGTIGNKYNMWKGIK